MTMMLMFRHTVLTIVLIVQAWMMSTVNSEENQLTRHSGHKGHDQNEMRWDEWSEWTDCSVNCGRGIQTRSRDCRSVLDGSIIDGCTGRREEIRICEFTGCLREAENIAECKKLETRVFGGKRYRWKPYKHPRDECQLACRPIGAEFYIEVGKTISDGNLCGETRNKVCIAGTCKPVGCDQVVESGANTDNCGVCGGDNSTCSQVSKTFTDSVKFGYHTIATIPRGATKIKVSEAAGARNYLGVRATDKSFSINTNFRLSRFGNIPGAGTVFKYSRRASPDCPDECIHADGPTDVAVEIVVLFYSDNSGISYSYNVPADHVGHSDKDDGTKPMVHIGGGSIPGTFGDEGSRIRDNKKRPIFSSDFKFKKNGRRRKHRHHRKHNRNKGNNEPENNSVTGETGALQKPKTKTQSTVTKSNVGTNFNVYYKNDTVVIEASNKTNTVRTVHGNNPDGTKNAHNRNDKYDQTDSFIAQKADGNGDKDGNAHNGIAEDDFGGGPNPKQEIEVNNVDGDDDDNEAVDDVEVDEDKTGSVKEESIDKESQGNSTEAPPAQPNSVTDSDMYTNDNREPSLYSWKISGYTECSQTCGTGKQSPILECIVTDKQAQVDDSFCSDQDRPSTAVLECSNGACPPSWTPRSWSKCSVTCGLGTQSRDYVCQGPDGEEAPASRCEGARPGRQDRTCDLGSCAFGWYFTEWEKECPAHCGYGTLTRRVHCSSDSGNINAACNQRDKPEESKSCRNDDCGGFWVTGPWSKCNATCGLAYQTRPVACAQKQRTRITIVSESGCQDEEKPATYMSCDLEPCEAQWFMTDWGDCTVSCGTGHRSRDVRCLDDKFEPSADCDKGSKPADKEECSSNRPCPLSDESRDKPVKPKKNPVVKPEEREIPAGCQDKFTQCSMVLKNRLCRYKYYQKICCRSCEISKKS